MTIEVRTEITAQTDGAILKPSAALATVVSAPESIAFVDLAVVIPAFNEQNGIQQGIEELNRTLSQLDLTYEILVVNDGSTDRTREKAEEAGVRVINQRENRGYGAALKKGIASSNSTYIAIIDADGTYPASALPEMLRLAATAEMVVGDRGAAMKNVPALRKPAKKMLNGLANYLAGRKINDLNSGLRVFHRRSLESFVPLLPDGFSFTTTITLCMVCSGLDVVYTPIAYGARVGESKIRAKHFFAFILLVLRAVMLFNPLRVFLPMGAVFVTLGVAKFAYDIYKWNLSESAVLAILGGLGAWALGLIADMISRIHLRP